MKLPRPVPPIGVFDPDTGLWVLVVHWICRVDDEYVLVLEPGFESDGASIPRVLWPIVGPRYDPSYFAAALAHDALYAAELFRRNKCDKVFYDLLVAMGVGRLKAAAMYLAVAAFGWVPWSRHSHSSVAKARKFARLNGCSASDKVVDWL